MAIAHAMWTHGHSLQVEFLERGKVERKGFSAKYTGTGMNWLHFAIPTPVIVNDDRLRVGSVMVRFRCGGSQSIGRVNAIHVYDGETKIVGKDNLNLSPNQWHFERIEVPGSPEVQWGLGISILVGFDPDCSGCWAEFSAAGCDFLS